MTRRFLIGKRVRLRKLLFSLKTLFFDADPNSKTSHIEVALFFAACLLELFQFGCRDAEHFFHIALKSFEIWVVFELSLKLFLVHIEILLKLFDVFGGVGLHSSHKLHALIFRPRKADFFAIVPAIHAPVHVHIVILNDPQDYV